MAAGDLTDRPVDELAQQELRNEEENHAFVGYNEWAKQELGVNIVTDFVYEYQADGKDRGVFIAEDIAPHTEVFRVPLTSLFTIQMCRKIEALQSIEYFQSDDPDREDNQLAIALLYEKFIAKSASKWAKHIELLPVKYHNVLYFNDQDLKLLQGSNLHFMAKHMDEKVAHDYNLLRESVLMEVFENITETINFDMFDEYFSLENYKWALSTIWSRFVSLRLSETMERSNPDDSKKQVFKAMIPVFDMLNHNPEAEMSHFYDVPTKSFKLVSKQHWNAGSQLFINYGALSNHKLLALYGFVIPENPFDAIDVWLPMDEPSTKHFQAKAVLLAENGMDHETAPFELTSTEVNELLLITARIEDIDCDTIEEFNELAKKALEGEVVSVENERATLTRLIDMLENMLNQYEGTLEEDDHLLNTFNESSIAESDQKLHERMAVTLRRSDKYILTENINMLKWKLLDILPKN